jgi:tetratricopeptide (TPR) repeat protein
MGARALAAAALLLLILGGSHPLGGIELPAGELWSRANAAADAGDFADADRQLGELLDSGTQIDISRYPLLARSAAGLAEQAYREGNAPLAEWSMAAAARLDPVTAAVPFAAADLARSRGDWVGGIRSVAGGLMKLMTDYSTGTLARMDLLLIFAIAIVLTAAGFAVALLVRYGRAATHDFREMLGGRLSAGVTSVLAFSLLFLPLFLWLGPVWLILWWLALMYAYGNLREKAAIVIILVAVALTPLLVDYAAARMAGLQNPVVRAAVADLNDAYDEGALVGMQSLLEAQPEDALLHLLLGNLYFQQGSDIEAVVHFRRAVQLDENLAGAHLNIGNLHFLNNDFTAAISRYERAAGLDPQMAIAPFNHSVAAAQMNRYDEQGRQLERAKQRSRSVVNQLTRKPPVQKVASYELPLADAWDSGGEDREDRRSPGSVRHLLMVRSAPVRPQRAHGRSCGGSHPGVPDGFCAAEDRPGRLLHQMRPDFLSALQVCARIGDLLHAVHSHLPQEGRCIPRDEAEEARRSAGISVADPSDAAAPGVPASGLGARVRGRCNLRAVAAARLSAVRLFGDSGRTRGSSRPFDRYAPPRIAPRIGDRRRTGVAPFLVTVLAGTVRMSGD